jgi:hypothetical protein
MRVSSRGLRKTLCTVGFIGRTCGVWSGMIGSRLSGVARHRGILDHNTGVYSTSTNIYVTRTDASDIKVKVDIADPFSDLEMLWSWQYVPLIDNND